MQEKRGQPQANVRILAAVFRDAIDLHRGHRDLVSPHSNQGLGRDLLHSETSPREVIDVLRLVGVDEIGGEHRVERDIMHRDAETVEHVPVELRVLRDPLLRCIREKRPERLPDPGRVEISASLVADREVKRAAGLERDGDSHEFGFERIQSRGLGVERDVVPGVGERASERGERLGRAYHAVVPERRTVGRLDRNGRRRRLRRRHVLREQLGRLRRVGRLGCVQLRGESFLERAKPQLLEHAHQLREL